MAVPIHFTTGDGILHRGYRDPSGEFTLEQCNLAKAREAGTLTVLEGYNDDQARTTLEQVSRDCGNCFDPILKSEPS